MARLLAPFALIVALAAVSLSAQGTTWIVSVAGGAGVHFTELPDAVAAAADGDTILIRAGTYRGFATGKALTLLGEEYVVISGSLSGVFGDPAVTVQGLAPGRTFAMKNLEVRHQAGFDGIHLQGNLGRVHAEDVSVSLLGAALGAIGASASVTATNSAEVTWSGGVLSGRPGLRVRDSVIVLTSVQLFGHSSCSGSLCATTLSSPAIILSDSRAYLSRTTAHGGAAGGGTFFYQPPSPAIVLIGGRLILTGDQTSTIQSGGTVEAIQGFGGVVEVDTTVPLVTKGGAPDITGAQVVRRRIVSLTARGAPPGGMLSIELVSPAGDPINLLAGVPSDPIPLSVGTIFLDPRILLPLALGVQGPSEHFQLDLRVPNLPALRGGVLAFQAGNYYQATQRLEFSNPAIVVLH